MATPVVLIQGGGLGLDQEVAVRRVLEAAQADLTFEVFPAGLAALQAGHGAPLPKAMLDAVRNRKLALKTKLLNPPSSEFKNFNVQLRQELGLFAAVRPLRNQPGLAARFQDVDILLVREITEDLYTAIEHEIVPGVVQSLKVVTEAACRRFFRFTFDLTRRQGRKTVHCIHKANILKLADGLVLHTFRAVAKDYPDIQPKEMIVDNCCMQLVSKPRQFDVLACGNLYGDLLSDLGAGLIGGISTATGINHGEGVTVYEAIHGGTQEDAGGPNRCNPLPLLFPAMHLLRDLGQVQVATRIQKAVDAVLLAGRVRPGDLGGTATTTEMTEAIVAAL